METIDRLAQMDAVIKMLTKAQQSERYARHHSGTVGWDHPWVQRAHRRAAWQMKAAARLIAAVPLIKDSQPCAVCGDWPPYCTDPRY